ncbi:Calcium-regulated heat stable 1 [Brachionus plicatilis]|uniref:Calcium-regulated heat stable 1 n=1 Tax=Brachionus plicatilis TaxID=10195 RepID=A0A3M7SYV0_BRAPC|nr:Calcium-regulated heat stable 1 [Brachionus plicatilis]
MSSESSFKSHEIENSIPENRELETPIKNYIDHLNEHHLDLIPHKRTRTLSEHERIANGPTFRGTIISFCRNKGHGFVKPDDESEPLFVHISDIEGSWCPKEGDIVSFKKELVPPKNIKYQAIHVHFVHLKEGVKHEHWDTNQTN